MPRVNPMPIDSPVARLPASARNDNTERIRLMTAETAESPLPAWSELTDLDKGAVLLHLHKRGREGADYAIDNYPARYFDHPALTVLSERDACEHAASMAGSAGELSFAEEERLYDLALDADRARWNAEHAKDIASAMDATEAAPQSPPGSGTAGTH